MSALAILGAGPVPAAGSIGGHPANAGLHAPAAATTGTPVPLARTLEGGGKRLNLVSCRTRNFLWFDLYVAALYLSDRGIPAFGDPREPKAVRMTILAGEWMPRRIPGRYLKVLERTAPRLDLEAVQDRVARMARGDTLWVYVTDGGELALDINGEAIARAPAEAVTPAVLDAWRRDRTWQDKLDRLIARNPC